MVELGGSGEAVQSPLLTKEGVGGGRGGYEGSFTLAATRAVLQRCKCLSWNEVLNQVIVSSSAGWVLK